MSILIDRNTKVITQGITGKTGQFHTRMCRDYANGRNAFVAGVNPKKAGEDFEGIPIYATVREAKDATGATVSVIYVPPPFAAAAIDEAVDADLDLVVCITEGIPVRDMIRTRDRMEGKKSLLLGPNCPGVITPDELKIGIMPGHIHLKGNIGVVSRSGTLTYEAVGQLTEIGLGQSTAVGIGGDPVNGLKHIDVLRRFNDDPETIAVVMIGEIGGSDEETAAQWVKENMRKPVVGFIAGVTAPPGKRMGHAGAIISGGKGTAQEKLAVMEACGIKVTRNPAEMGKLIKAVLSAPLQQQATALAFVPMDLFSPPFWVAALEIIVINILLSGDNAVVIALACRNLPKKQRVMGIFWGVIGAVVLRILLTFFAVQLLLLPYLQILGAALLLWIGIKLITEEEGEAPEVEASDRLFSAVRTVIVADLVMSLDNVIGVAGAAKGSLLLLIFGLVVSIPLVVVGAQLIVKLVHRFPSLVIAGGGLLGYIAGEIATEDAAVAPWINANVPALHYVAPAVGILVVVAAGIWLTRRRGSAPA